MNASIRWERVDNKGQFKAYVTDHSAGGEDRGYFYIAHSESQINTKANTCRQIEFYIGMALGIPMEYLQSSLLVDKLVTSSIYQLRALGLDLTEGEEDSLGLEPGTWDRIGEAYAKQTSNPPKMDLSPGAIHINPHMTSQNPPLVDEEEPETWTVGTSHGSGEWFDDETLEKEYNEMLEEGKEDFGINTAEKVDGGKALDILKSLI